MGEVVAMHEGDVTGRESASEVREPTDVRTSWKIKIKKALKRQWLDLEEKVPLRGIGRFLWIDEKRIRQWFDVKEEASIPFSDLMAIAAIDEDHRKFVVAVLNASLDMLDRADPQPAVMHLPPDRHAVRTGAAIGDIHQAVDEAELDGKWERHEVLRVIELVERAIKRLQQFHVDLLALLRELP